LDGFFLVDEKTGEKISLTREEKERIFLDSMQSYYYSGKGNLPDEQFDALKADLTWEGSALVNLNRNETLYMNAMQAYTKGKPILSDKQWDDLKKSLRESGSQLAVSVEPTCYVDTGVCKVTWKKDGVRTSTLYLPALFFGLIIYLGTIYEIDAFAAMQFNPLFSLLIGSYPIYTIVKAITENVLFKVQYNTVHLLTTHYLNDVFRTPSSPSDLALAATPRTGSSSGTCWACRATASSLASSAPTARPA
jgi:hypothetical protein